MHNPLGSDPFPVRHQAVPHTPADANTSRAPSKLERQPREEVAATTRRSQRTKSAPNPDTIAAELANLEAARLAQLQDVSDNVRDAVSGAYRDSVLRALESIRTARERLAAGTYGLCSCCSKAIPPERLELLPSATMCVGCAIHSRAG